jgi:hypothetical protein
MKTATLIPMEATTATAVMDVKRSPEDPGLSLEATVELDSHTMGFVVRVEGTWTETGLVQFRHFLSLHYLAPTDDELLRSLERARWKYFQGDNHLFLCGAQPCCNSIGFDASNAALIAASRKAGLPISKTGCLGHCKHSPVLSLRVGDRCQMLAGISDSEAWLAALCFARSAAEANSLMVDPGNAGQFFFDPVHRHAKPDNRLAGLLFLIGHFRGEGRFAMSNYVFQKELVGSIEAGGRFIALRMDASYPLADGRKDVHKALVVVGSQLSSGALGGHAYTDGGSTLEYEVEQLEHTFQFADASPDHARHWKRARKILRPTGDGFEERLEVDAGEGFLTYYTINMRKVVVL